MVKCISHFLNFNGIVYIKILMVKIYYTFLAPERCTALQVNLVSSIDQPKNRRAVTRYYCQAVKLIIKQARERQVTRKNCKVMKVRISCGL